MVQSLAISVGNANSYVAAGQGGGVEILLNDYSNRSTPSMVGFTRYCRSIGVDAYQNLFLNLKNTIFDIMQLLGKSFEDIDCQKYPFVIEEDEEGKPVVVVKLISEERKFSITQILAMLFTKLRGVAGNATDCVISCPQFYTELQKHELLEAALVAGLKPLQIMSDMAAVALNYAYFRTTHEDTPKNIAFINFGQSNLQVLIAGINPKENVVKVLATESEQIGGKDFDQILADHFIQQHNLKLNPKAKLKMNSSCEKLKQLLSANANEIPIHVESLISENEDFTSRIDRVKFDELSQGLLQRVEACMRRSLENAKAQDSEVEFKLDVVEMVGGSIRIPAVKQLVQKVFEMSPSTTLNTDEAVARGCLIHCATLHPGVKINRIIKIEGTDDLFYKSDKINCNQKFLEVEQELIALDCRHKVKTESRNNLEEFIYSARSNLKENDVLQEPLNQTLDWLFSDEGDDASADDYSKKLEELRELGREKAPEKGSQKGSEKGSEKACEKACEKGSD